MKYKDWILEWLSNYVKPSSKVRTYVRYAEICKLHIIPTLGEVDVKNVDAVTLQRFVSELLSCGNLKTGGGLSSNYVNTVISVVQNSLKAARFVGVTDDYVGDKIKRPKVSEKQVESFTLKEQKSIESYVFQSKTDTNTAVLFCAFTRV